MSSSGVLVNPECTNTFQQMAEGKKEIRYIIFKIEDKEIVVETARQQSDMPEADDYEDNSKCAFAEFTRDLKERTDDLHDCRYAIFDFKFTAARQGLDTKSKMDKIIFIQLCPDGSAIKKKMVYASSASAIKSALGTDKMLSFQVSEECDLSHTDLLSKLAEKFRF